MMTIAKAIAQSGAQPELTYQALERLVDDTIGVKLFTLMEVDHDRGVAWRSYTNRPNAYPVLGEKPMVQNKWYDIVNKNGQTFVANSIEDIAEVFADHELIQSLGCESCLNLPIFINGEIRGTLNCLHEAGHYTADRIDAAQTLKPAGALAFLMAESLRNQGENHG